MLSFRKMFYGKTDSIAQAAFIISFFSLASKILGLLRDRILAGSFGAGDTLDIYYAAFRIPDTIFNLLIIGALSASFIPILSGHYYKNNTDRFFKVANNVLNIFFAAVIAAGIIMFFLMPYLLKFVVPGWTGEKFETTVTLTRIMLLSPIFLTLSSVANGILQSTKRFLVYAASPIGYNAGIIIGAVFLAKFWAIYGLAFGVILGAALQFLFVWPAVKNLGYSYKFSFGYKDPDIRRIFKLMLPRTLSLGVGQINLVVITSVASTLGAGSLTVFNFATNIQNIFFGLIGISFAVAVFPAMASYLAAGESKKFTESFSKTYREIILFIIPSTAYLVIFKTEIVRLIYGAGKFDPASAVLTENTLVFLALGLIAQSLISLVVRTYWALGDTKTPFYTSLLGLAVTVIAAVALGRQFGVVGLAIAFSLANIADFIMLSLFLRRKPIDWDESNIFKSFFKISLATMASGALAWYLMGILPFGKGAASAVILFLRLGIGTLLMAALFILFSKILEVKEIFVFTRAFKRRFGKKEAVYIEEMIDQK